ncbi:ATP-binding protein [Undibacterium sp. Ji83W]|uniref:ATP-binding protein n=1 Tax=Undibacterium sp. Ji83W TaxID=3413043 RepID=UPI003BF34DC8
MSEKKHTTPVEEFKGKMFKHPSATAAYEGLLQAMGNEFSSEIIILTGPTGVGKSTVATAVGKAVLDKSRSRMEVERDFVPVVALRAVPPTSGNFDWKDFYIRLLSEQGEPFSDRKLYVPRQMSLLHDSASTDHLENSVTNCLRRSVEEYLRRRRTKLLIIDEAHHLLMVSNGHRLECQFETLKSLAIETGTTILLSGTYSLLNILLHSGQLTRRSQVVNFGRYDMRCKKEAHNFQRTLTYIEHLLSAYVPTKLNVDVDYFYQKSIGCVGILKDWMTRCLDHAIQEKAPQIDATFANRFALPNRGLMRILEEAVWGESELADVGDDLLLDLLKHGLLDTRNDKPVGMVRRKPGKRKPQRDPVGGHSHGTK